MQNALQKRHQKARDAVGGHLRVLLFGSVAVLEYGAIVWAAFFLFVLGYEEPALGEQFPEEYKRYRANVRRWIPRTTPGRGDH